MATWRHKPRRVPSLDWGPAEVVGEGLDLLLAVALLAVLAGLLWSAS